MRHIQIAEIAKQKSSKTTQNLNKLNSLFGYDLSAVFPAQYLRTKRYDNGVFYKNSNEAMLSLGK